jgi:hypothetical protein
MEKEPRFSTCANPECAVPFNFRQGRLFRFYGNHAMGNAASMNPYSLKHLWLCKECVELYTLEYHDGRGLLIPLAASKAFAASIHSELPVLIEEIAATPAAEPEKRSKRKVNSKHGRVKRRVKLLLDSRSLVRGSL